jgi:hypothetical protein
MTGRPNRAHHQGDYSRRARAVRDWANSHPDTICWRCGLTQVQYATTHGARAARWQAGHVVDGQVGGELLPEHARCNAQAGNRAREPRSQRWY